MAPNLFAVDNPYVTGSGLVIFNASNILAVSNLCANNAWGGILTNQRTISSIARIAAIMALESD